MLVILRYICPHSGIFWQIQGYSKPWHSQTCSCVLTLSAANPLKWSNTLKQFVRKVPTNCLSMFDHFVGLALKGLRQIQSPWLIPPYSEPLTYLASFRRYLAIHAYSEPYLSRFRHIQNSGLFRHVIYHANSYLHRGIPAHIGIRHFQDPGITGSSNVSNACSLSQQSSHMSCKVLESPEI